MAATASNRYAGGPSPSGLADVLDLILDKGLVIDAYVRLSLIGIEILTVDARVVVASVDTYLRFAEAVGRLDVDSTKPTPVELARTGKYRATKAATSGALDAAGEKIADWLSPD
jgi:gas vesicle structural protein